MQRRTRTPVETEALGYELASELRAGTTLSLVGDLGTGKTQFVKGLARGLGITLDVTSPTFTLVNIYSGGRHPLYHLDLYRLQSEAELDEIGFDEYVFGPGVCAVEWGDRFQQRLPETCLTIRFGFAEKGRVICW